MGGIHNGGAVYNYELHRMMDRSTGDLRTILDDWAKKTHVQKFWAHCSLLTAWELRLKAAKDLIAAREDPSSEIAKKINPKLASWSAERAVPVAA